MHLIFMAVGILLALVFIISGLGKLADLQGTRQTLAAFGLPASLNKPMAILLPLFELGIALAVLIPATTWWGTLAALLLMALFIAVVAYQLARRRHPACRCFGQLGGGPIGPGTILRNGIFAALAVVTLIHGWTDVQPTFGAWLGDTSPVDATLLAFDLALLAGIGILGALMVIAYQRLRRAMPQAGSTAVISGQAETRTVSIPQPPQIGEPAPVLELANLRGERIDLASLTGQEFVLVFSRPDCPACKVILPDLERYACSPRAGNPAIVVVSRGSAIENRDYARLSAPVLLAQSDAVAFAFGVPGTPSAIRIDASGNVASAAVFGTIEVKRLLGLMPKMTQGQDEMNGVPGARRATPPIWKRALGLA